MRPISAFVQLAGRFQSDVCIYNEANEKFDGKSPLSLLGLGAEDGTELVLEVYGPDQEQAVQVLLDLMENLARYDANDEPESPIS